MGYAKPGDVVLATAVCDYDLGHQVDARDMANTDFAVTWFPDETYAEYSCKYLNADLCEHVYQNYVYEDGYPVASPAADVTINEGEVTVDAFWAPHSSAGTDAGYPYTVIGDETYVASMRIETDFGYYIADSTNITVSGGTVSQSSITSSIARIDVNVVAEHVWTVTKKSTPTEEGIETDKCGDQPDRKFIYTTTKGNNSRYVLNSGKDLEFTIKRSVGDEKTHENLLEASVDGSTITKGTDYEDSQGSEIIQLKSSFLEGLSAGKHTLRIEFSDGAAEATFTVSDGSSKPSTPVYVIPETGIE